MKNLIKYCAIIFALLLAGSIITSCVKVGLLIVRGISEKDFGIIRVDGEVVFDWNTIEEEEMFGAENGGVRIFGIQFGGEVETKSGTFDVTEPVTEIEVDGVTGELEIVRGDTFLVTYEEIPVDYTMSVRDGKLLLKDESKRVFVVNFGQSEAHLCLTIPENVELKKVKVDNGSGKLTISELAVETLVLDGGSGNMTAENVATHKIVVSGGSGNVRLTNLASFDSHFDMGSGGLTIKNGALGNTKLDSGSGSCRFENAVANNLVADSGSGKIVYEGILTGNCIFDSGSGPIRLDIEGAKEDYSIRASLGSGGIYINGRKAGSDNYTGNTGGEHSLIFNTGSGSVSVNFSE